MYYLLIYDLVPLFHFLLPSAELGLSATIVCATIVFNLPFFKNTVF